MILALDPSLTCFGWLLAHPDGTILTAGATRTQPQAKKRHIFQADDDARRTDELLACLIGLATSYKVTGIASEQPAGAQSATAAKALGISLAVVVAVARAAGPIEVRWVRAVDAKKALAGTANASKNEMVAAAVRCGVPIIPYGPKPLREAIADAYGVLLASGLWHPRMAPNMPDEDLTDHLNRGAD